MDVKKTRGYKSIDEQVYRCYSSNEVIDPLHRNLSPGISKNRCNRSAPCHAKCIVSFIGKYLQKICENTGKVYNVENDSKSNASL